MIRYCRANAGSPRRWRRSPPPRRRRRATHRHGVATFVSAFRWPATRRLRDYESSAARGRFVAAGGVVKLKRVSPSPSSSQSLLRLPAPAFNPVHVFKTRCIFVLEEHAGGAWPGRSLVSALGSVIYLSWFQLLLSKTNLRRYGTAPRTAATLRQPPPSPPLCVLATLLASRSCGDGCRAGNAPSPLLPSPVDPPPVNPKKDKQWRFSS